MSPNLPLSQSQQGVRDLARKLTRIYTPCGGYEVITCQRCSRQETWDDEGKDCRNQHADEAYEMGWRVTGHKSTLCPQCRKGQRL